MSEEEKEVIKRIKKLLTRKPDYDKGIWLIEQDVSLLLNLIEKQQKEIDKLKNHNKDLLRKLRNRVKEVNKLTKYSQYKKEFSKLNQEIEKDNNIISDLQNEVTLKDSEIDKKEHEIKELKKQLIALTYKSSVKGVRR